MNRDDQGVWSTDGCQVAESNESTVMCYCNHLTSFAVLIKVTNYEVKDSLIYILEYISCFHFSNDNNLSSSLLNRNHNHNNK